MTGILNVSSNFLFIKIVGLYNWFEVVKSCKVHLIESKFPGEQCLYFVYRSYASNLHQRIKRTDDNFFTIL